VRTADNLSTFIYRLSWNLGASISWNHQGLSRPVMGLFFSCNNYNFYPFISYTFTLYLQRHFTIYTSSYFPHSLSGQPSYLLVTFSFIAIYTFTSRSLWLYVIHTYFARTTAQTGWYGNATVHMYVNLVIGTTSLTSPYQLRPSKCILLLVTSIYTAT
jgi:hypothetical protein